jgi:putative molybdopterin biosynthesis protein
VETETKEFYSPEEIAERLQVNKMTVYRLLTRGELPYYQIGKLKRISRGDFDTYLRNNRVAGKNE